MPGKERTRRPGTGQYDLTDLLAADPGPATEADAQAAAAAAAGALHAGFGDPDERTWATSPYGWIRHLPAARKGRVAERLVAAYLARAGIVVGTATGPGHSFTVNGRRVKVRLSLRWASGEFRFQQLESGDYDTLLLLGVAPDRVHAWVVDRDTIAGHLDASTGWLAFPAATPPAYLAGHGPDLVSLPDRLH